MTQPGSDGTLYRAYAPEQRDEAAAPAVPASEAVPQDFTSARAVTTRGMIGRPASQAALDAIAAAQAASIAAARVAEALPDVTARPAEIVPDPPRSGTVYGRAKEDRSAKVLAGRMARLHIGWHTATIDAVTLIGVSSAGTGLVIGADRRHRPVPIRFFRTEATQIALVGGAWAAQILTLRSLALGATVVVRSDDPARWRAFAGRVALPDRLLVNIDPVLAAPTPSRPLLLVADGDVADDGGPSRPWQTRLRVLRRLDETGIAAIQDSQLVIAQRLGAAESAIAATALRLPGAATAPLQQIDDETVALLDGSGHAYARINATEIERSYAGGAER
ncbi:MAG TPA: hypothetical protein VGJ28_16150 [Micromonosporaceae bacterium]|jgi:hypothetical protein